MVHLNTNGDIFPCDPTLAEHEIIAADAAVVAQINTVANASILQPPVLEMSCWMPANQMGVELCNGAVPHGNAAEKIAAFQETINAS